MTRVHVKVAVVGAGLSGLAMAIRLKQSKIREFVILEKSEDVGGAWQHNAYPGYGCDVPSHPYSLSFAPTPAWSRTYSARDDVRRYLRHCVERFGLRTQLRTNTEVKTATWRGDAGVWEIETSTGLVIAQVLVCGTGPAVEPLTPHLAGVTRFKGKIMHSARWDHDYDLTGKRVASIGTGGSAVQYIPEIQPRLAQLHVFQRTAPWVMPDRNRPISERERDWYRRIPLAQRLVRAGIHTARDLLLPGIMKHPQMMSKLQAVSRAHIGAQVSDPGLLARVTPDYQLGYKRLLQSNNWYPALSRPNVNLVAGEVREVREQSVVGADNTEHEVDAIIFGTGVQVTDMPIGRLVRGRAGRLLEENSAVTRRLTRPHQHRDFRTFSCCGARSPAWGAVRRSV